MLTKLVFNQITATNGTEILILILDLLPCVSESISGRLSLPLQHMITFTA